MNFSVSTASVSSCSSSTYLQPWFLLTQHRLVTPDAERKGNASTGSPCPNSIIELQSMMSRPSATYTSGHSFGILFYHAAFWIQTFKIWITVIQGHWSNVSYSHTTAFSYDSCLHNNWSFITQASRRRSQCSSLPPNRYGHLGSSLQSSSHNEWDMVVLRSQVCHEGKTPWTSMI